MSTTKTIVCDRCGAKLLGIWTTARHFSSEYDAPMVKCFHVESVDMQVSSVRTWGDTIDRGWDIDLCKDCHLEYRKLTDAFRQGFGITVPPLVKELII